MACPLLGLWPTLQRDFRKTKLVDVDRCFSLAKWPKKNNVAQYVENGLAHASVDFSRL